MVTKLKVMRFKIVLHILISLLFVSSCQKQDNAKTMDARLLVEQVKSQVQAFHAADTSKNAQGMLDLLWPEFTMLVDGHPITYEDVETGSKSFMASLKTFHTEWKDLKIIPLGEQHAISSFTFTDSIVAKDGTITQSTGPNTFVWEKRDGQWKVIYGDADHYPIELKR